MGPDAILGFLLAALLVSGGVTREIQCLRVRRTGVKPPWVQAVRVPAPQGARGGAGDIFACAIGRLRLDMRLEWDERGHQLAVTGRVSGEDPAELLICFLVDGEIRRRDAADRSGEFDFDFERGNSFSLCLCRGDEATHIALVELPAAVA